jgi:bifunctional non-homologous end joining protein LigD
MIKRSSITKHKTNNKKQTPQTIGKSTKKNSPIHLSVEKIIRSLPQQQTSEIPNGLKPMLATKINEPFNDRDWIFEVKWDGYRCISYLNNGNADLRSRSNISYNKIYTPVVEALKEWNINVVVDGEIIVVNEQGKSDFEALQKWQQTKEGVLIYYVFDILWLNGINLTSLPLSQRKDILKKLIPQKSIIKFSDSIEEYGIDFYEIAKSNELEGIVAKKKDSSYEPAKRTNNWLKIPAQVRQEFVIGGWTESSSSRSFKSLLFGYYVKGKLHYVGHAGGGFKESEMPAILKKLKKYSTDKSPFVNDTDIDDEVHWIKPELVAEIKYASFTSAGKIRKPAIFLGFRDDKKATDVVNEINSSAEPLPKESKTERHDIENNWQILENQKITSSGRFTIDGYNLTLTNVEKQLWKGITKSDLIQYYNAVSSYILPYLKQRPLSLHIKHLSPTAPGIYIKDMESHAPEWAEIFSIERKHKKSGKRNIIDYLICNNTATLLYCINLGCIDVNPWTSHVPSIQKPDFIIIDLDPSDEDFNKVITVASAAKEFFDQRKIAAFPKTSGKTGLHIYLPCSGFDFMEARAIAENICEEIHNMVPRISTTEINIAERGDKLYIDPGQNDFADTVASVYSVRPFKDPTVSTPLNWKEIKNGLDPQIFTIRTILHRLKKQGDIFSPVLSSSVQKKNNKLLKLFLD